MKTMADLIKYMSENNELPSKPTNLEIFDIESGFIHLLFKALALDTFEVELEYEYKDLHSNGGRWKFHIYIVDIEQGSHVLSVYDRNTYFELSNSFLKQKYDTIHYNQYVKTLGELKEIISQTYEYYKQIPLSDKQKEHLHELFSDLLD